MKAWEGNNTYIYAICVYAVCMCQFVGPCKWGKEEKGKLTSKKTRPINKDDKI